MLNPFRKRATTTVMRAVPTFNVSPREIVLRAWESVSKVILLYYDEHLQYRPTAYAKFVVSYNFCYRYLYLLHICNLPI